MLKISPIYHKLKSIIGYSIAAIVIVIAIGVSGLRLLLTTANLYQNEVEQLASNILKQPVKIGSIDAKLSNLVPTLILNNVQLTSKKTKKNLFSLSRVDVGLSFSDLLLSQKITPEEIVIRGMDLHVTRTKDGALKVKGVDVAALKMESKDNSISFVENWLLQQGNISIEDSSVTWVDEQNEAIKWFFHDIDLLLTKKHKRYQFIFSSKLPNILGDKVKMSFDLVGDITSPKTWDVKAFIESRHVNLKPLKKYIKNEQIDLKKGVVDVQLWADWKNEEVKQLSGNVKLYDVLYRYKKNKEVNLKFVSGIFDSLKNEKGTWNISVDNFNYASNKTLLNYANFSLAFNYDNKSIKTFYIKTDEVKLDAISKIVSDNHLVKPSVEKNIIDLELQGDVRDLYIAWQNKKLHSLNASFSGLSANALGNIPKVKSLSGNLMYEKNKGVISLASKESMIGFPHLFRNDLTFNELSADIQFLNTNKGIYFDVKELKTENQDVKASSKAALWLPKNGSSPHLDFQTYVSEGDASKVSKYLPVGIMDESLIKWLDQGIVSGKVNKGNIVFRGKLEDFPYNNKKGIFSANIEASNVEVNYWNGWPKIEKANIQGNFTGQGLQVHLLKGMVNGNSIFNSFAKINSFSAAELDVDINTAGSTHNIMQYIVNSPILPKAKKLINNSRLAGDVAGNIKIHIPLDEKSSAKKSLSYSGTASLSKSSLFMLDDKIDFKAVSGDILFNEKKIYSKDLIATVFDENVNLSISSTNKNIKISGKGKINPGIALQRFSIPGAKNISGRTRFYGSMNFPLKKGKKHYPSLSINSNLIGVKSRFPEMLFKRKNKKQKTKLITTFLDKKLQIGLYFDKKGSSVLELVTRKNHTYLKKGAVSFSKNKAILPKENVLYVDGSIDKFTPTKWSKVLGYKRSATTKDFLINPIVFNLGKLNILSTDKKATKKTSDSINPRNIPVFKGVIQNLYFDKMFLGQLDLNVSKNRNGLHFGELHLSTKNMSLFSHGDWNYVGDKHKTNMNITLNSENVGAMLTDLGHSSIIEKGKAKTTSKIYWDGALTDFSLKNIQGNIKLNVVDGNIKNIDAGAGRLLGLVSLSALPRKLFGDFKDTFKSGYSFDTAKGVIKISKGSVFTDNFEVKSSVSNIKISGRTGLVNRDYDNVIKVIPDVGGGLAGVAALLVNLPAGIGLWLVDKLTGEQFDDVSTNVYKVKGTWDEPKIDLIDDK